jgi:hypothetical protein
MDFIEQIFGFSPDGGNGLLELLLILVPLTATAVLIVRRRLARARNDRDAVGWRAGQAAEPGLRETPRGCEVIGNL